MARKTPSKSKPQTRNTERVNWSLWPHEVEQIAYYKRLLGPQAGWSDTVRWLINEVNGYRHREGKPIPPAIGRDIAELS